MEGAQPCTFTSSEPTVYSPPTGPPYRADVTTDDRHLWLEDITGAEALSWVDERNAEAERELASSERFRRLQDGILEVLDSESRIPYVARRGPHRYNFWQGAEHPRGVWRRTTLEEYAKENPRWEVLLDLDELARREGVNWVWAGAECRAPDYGRALVALSRGGADAVLVREFDLTTRSFVAGGFELPEAKCSAEWIDEDHIFVATDFGPGTLTDSSYPRTVRRWRRGTPLADAEVIYEGLPSDIAIAAYHDATPGFERDYVVRRIEYYRVEIYWLTDTGELRLIEVPDDAIATVHREWLLVELRSEWTVGGVTHPRGSLVAIHFDAFLAGDRDLVRLFTPDAHTSLVSYDWTRGHLLLNLMRDVTSELAVLTPTEYGEWPRRELAGVPPLCTATALGTEPDRDDEYELQLAGFCTPSTLALGTIDAGPAVVLKAEPEFFDADGHRVTQHFATSPDGTRVPYFVVAPSGPAPAEGWPTLLHGYGSFGVPLQPAYLPAMGRGWLERGGCYVVANIRGGGEYGPSWHRAALKENRHLVYEDFATVARDLIARGVTTPDRLGIRGASAGGLLVTVMLTRHPELLGAVVARVPLTDMRRYSRLLAGASWIAEYGDPDAPDEWAYVAEHSPYQRIEPDAAYPPVLCSASTRDDRVHPGHARKLVARLREFGHRVTYYENVEGGHRNAADNKQHAFVIALEYEFLWRELGGSQISGRAPG